MLESIVGLSTRTRRQQIPYLEAARIGRRLLERLARDARSFGELPSFPNDKEPSPCPHSHHTSSSPSSSSSWPCYRTEWSITLWAATSPASPTGLSWRSSFRFWCSVALIAESPRKGVRPPRFGTDATSGSNLG